MAKTVRKPEQTHLKRTPGAKQIPQKHHNNKAPPVPWPFKIKKQNLLDCIDLSFLRRLYCGREVEWWFFSYKEMNDGKGFAKTSNVPQTHFKRTSNAPSKYLKRTSNAPQLNPLRKTKKPQAHLKRTSKAPSKCIKRAPTARSREFIHWTAWQSSKTFYYRLFKNAIPCKSKCMCGKSLLHANQRKYGSMHQFRQ